MIRLAADAVFAVALVAAAEPPEAGNVRRLVENLGSPEFTEREAATKRLGELGPAALDELRPACRSENPEVARRAQDLVRKIERRLANEKLLAPTLVELDAKDQPLDDVLAELSKQAKCEVVLGGSGLRALAERKVTVSTGGKVPFWTAVLKVCDTADLQVAGAGGYFAPDVTPPLPRGQAQPGVRAASDPNLAVVLETREAKTPRRPAAIRGAVLVEAIPFPKQASPSYSPAALLQVWPEPRLRWQATNSVKVVKATDPNGARLAVNTSAAEPSPPFQVAGNGVVVIRNPDGSARVVRDGVPGSETGFTPNAWQVLVRLKPGERPAEAVKELALSLFATVRVGVEPLSRASGLVPNRPANGVGVPGVDLSVTYHKDPNGKLLANVTLAYDSTAGYPATLRDELPGVKDGGAGFNYTVHGVRVTDADGKPYTLGLASGSTSFDPLRRSTVMKLTLELHPGKDGQGPPDAVTFWGTYNRPVEVPVTLKDVPLTGGK